MISLVCCRDFLPFRLLWARLVEMIILVRANIWNSQWGLKGVPLTAPPFRSIPKVLILASLLNYGYVDVTYYAYLCELVEFIIDFVSLVS